MTLNIREKKSLYYSQNNLYSYYFFLLYCKFIIKYRNYSSIIIKKEIK